MLQCHILFLLQISPRLSIPKGLLRKAAGHYQLMHARTGMANEYEFRLYSSVRRRIVRRQNVRRARRGGKAAKNGEDRQRRHWRQGLMVVMSFSMRSIGPRNLHRSTT